ALLENGEVIKKGKRKSMNTPPGESEQVTLRYELPHPKAGAEYHLNLHFILTEDTQWANAGFEVAWEQLPIPLEAPKKATRRAYKTAVEIIPDESQIDLRYSGGKVTFDPASGDLVGIEAKGQLFLSSPLVPNFWRAPLDNDILAAMFLSLAEPVMSKRIFWAQAANRRKLADFQMEQMADGSVEIVADYKIPSGLTPLSLHYSIFQNGEIEINYAFTPRQEMIRVGMTLALTAGFDQVCYFGLGPHETMQDRKASGAVGLYQGDVEGLIHDYTHPQENGNRSEVRWAEVTDQEGRGLRIEASGESLLNFSAWPYTQEDLIRAEHIHELVRRDETTINIGYAQKGVGDLFSYLEGYPDGATLPGQQEYKFSFILKTT
ncbi:MAG: beta-galactosidase small subunit family protein, partial [Anaerolineales bacterium]